MDYIRTLSKNPRFAKTLFDRVSVAIFIFGGLVALLFEIHVLMQYEASIYSFVFHVLLGLYLYLNVMGNLVKIITSTKSQYNFICCTKEKTDYERYCQICYISQPPRSHHCRVCDICILRRDHHCWFTGSCIGHFNQRYFFAMIFACFIAATYSNIYHLPYVYQILTTKLGIYFPLAIICPHIVFITRFISLYELIISMLTMLGFFCQFIFIWLLEKQVMQCLRGQTRYERKIDCNDYDLRKWQKNFENALGRKWYLALIWPGIGPEINGDGFSFNKLYKDH